MDAIFPANQLTGAKKHFKPNKINPFDPIKALSYWPNPPFFIFGIRALWHSGQSARMPEIKNSWLDQYGAEPFEQQQFGTAGIEWVRLHVQHNNKPKQQTNDKNTYKNETKSNESKASYSHFCARSDQFCTYVDVVALH